jgi:hypothetical protein
MGTQHRGYGENNGKEAGADLDRRVERASALVIQSMPGE